MKNILQIVIVLLAVLIGCKDINDIHKEYLDRGEKIYLGRPDSVLAQQGYEKIQLKWLLNRNPNISTTVIYWNDRRDSIEHHFDNASENSRDSVMINNLEERIYVFEIINKGDNNIRSLPAEVSKRVLGKEYRKTLSPCPFEYSFSYNEETLTIKWQPSDDTNKNSIVRYTSKSDGDKKEITCLYDKKPSVIGDVKSTKGETVDIISFYKPNESACEYFRADTSQITFDIILHAGIYVSSGYFDHPTAPRELALEKTLSKLNDNTLICGHSDLGGSGYTITMTVNSDYSVTVKQFAPDEIGEMVPGAVNKYDPVSKTFTLNYRYMGGNGWRTVNETLKLKE